MGRYIDFLIKNDSYECSNFEKAEAYATKVFEILNPAWKSMPYAGNDGWVEADEEYPDSIEIDFSTQAPWPF